MLSTICAALLRSVPRWQREQGQALAEYGLIIALVAIFLITALGLLALAIEGTFNDIIAAF